MRSGPSVGRWWPWLLSLCALSPAWADTAQDWLERMNVALAEKSYDGTFFHMRDGRSESLRIVHRVRDGNVCERLMSLDGTGREFIRRGEELRYYLPEKGLVLVERRERETGLLPSFPSLKAASTELYDFGEVRRVRLMGRDTRLVTVEPRDEFRYGYRVWIDARTHMPLKSELHDGRGAVLEQLMFANLAVFKEIPDHLFEPPASAKGLTTLHGAGRSAEGRMAIQRWRVRALPKGFRMIHQFEQALPGAEEPVAHLVFSDGLASVSVFIGERLPARSAKEVALERRLGASTTYSTEIAGHQIVVVGEVPPDTARFIASQLQAARQ
ncbi:MAG: MucB/RseB C-terminal domain-containing protein [Steroidobacteraceae bacterium]